MGCRLFSSLQSSTEFILKDPQVKLLDLDGDGLIDALRSGTRLECFLNNPEAGWTKVSALNRRNIALFPNLDLADPGVRVADMSGDGLQDLVLIHHRAVDYCRLWSSPP